MVALYFMENPNLEWMMTRGTTMTHETTKLFVEQWESRCGKQTCRMPGEIHIWLLRSPWPVFITDFPAKEARRQWPFSGNWMLAVAFQHPQCLLKQDITWPIWPISVWDLAGGGFCWRRNSSGKHASEVDTSIVDGFPVVYQSFEVDHMTISLMIKISFSLRCFFFFFNAVLGFPWPWGYPKMDGVYKILDWKILYLNEF